MPSETWTTSFPPLLETLDPSIVSTVRRLTLVDAPVDLRADCSSCFALCCTAFGFSRSADFPVDKPAGTPCDHLAAGCSGCQSEAAFSRAFKRYVGQTPGAWRRHGALPVHRS